MFSRRVFEILASSTALVSLARLAWKKNLGSVIDVGNDLDSAKSKIRFLLENESYREQISHRGYRTVMQNQHIAID
ncbi:MAG: hypothetical protein CM15mP3_10760 [Candidatus Poseidoniales archaeon]|nr:MAG: hypothetical protein CM15mP3_10760 [Candidatus Poseidoniales archaeon]